MDPFTARKKELFDQIAQQITSAYEQKLFGYADAKEVSDYVTEEIKDVNDQPSLIKFLDELSFNWSMFEGLRDIESSKVQAVKEQAAVQDVADLIASGQTDQALDAAQKAMDKDE